MQTPAKASHVVFSGNLTTFILTANHENDKTPRNFPATRLIITTSPTPENKLQKLICDISIPALAKTNNGMTRKLTIP